MKTGLEVKTNEELNIFSSQTPNNLIFLDSEGKEVGRLEWNKDGVTFSGKADKSAEVFFEFFKRLYVGGHIKDNLRGL